MTRIVFETAALSDAVRKAARVAPTVRGAAFDKAHGLHLAIDPDSEHPLVLSATDTTMFWREWVSALDVSGPAVEWRLPSVPLSRVISTLPIGSGKTVILEEEESDNGRFKIDIQSGRGRWKFNTLDTRSFPTWDVFDEEELNPVTGLGGRIKSVEWAAAGDEGALQALNGVHLDGEVAVATDKYSAARVPCPIEHLDTKVTIPAGTLSVILKEDSTAKLGVFGQMVHCMPDDFTQVRIVTLAPEYPNFKRALKEEFPCQVEVDRDELVSCINRVTAMNASDRTPLVDLVIGKHEIVPMMMSDSEIGIGREVIDVEGADHPRIKYVFNPNRLTEALSAAPLRKVTIGYHQDVDDSPMISINSGATYNSWVARTVGGKA